MSIDDIFAQVMRDAQHNPWTQCDRPLSVWLLSTFVDDGMSPVTAAKLVATIDSEWVSAIVARPQFADLLRSSREGRRTSIDALSERCFGGIDDLYSIVRSGEWDVVVAAAGADIHRIVAQLVVLATETFVVSVEEAADGDLSISAIERNALSLLGARYASDRGRRIAARQRSLAVERAPIPPNAVLAKMASMALATPESFSIESTRETDRDREHIHVSADRNPGSDRSRVMVRIPRPDGSAPLLESVQARIVSAFASAFVLDFFLSILIALLRRIETSRARNDEKRPENAFHPISWDEIDAIGGFTERGLGQDRVSQIRRELCAFVHCLDGIRASGVDRDGRPIDEYLLKVRGVEGPNGSDGGPSGKFGRGDFALGPALISWLYGDSRHDAYFSLIDYARLKQSKIPPAKYSLFLRVRMMAAAIAGRSNDAHMGAAGATAHIAAGATIGDGLSGDPTIPTIKFTLHDLASLGFRIVQPDRSGPNAAIIAAKDRSRHLDALREILADLQSIGIIDGYRIHGDPTFGASTDKANGPIHAQPPTRPVVVVHPHMDALRHRLDLADASTPTSVGKAPKRLRA